ncbi:HNH endonuclease [Micromonospora sp. 4G57]|uniref:HNH endonuclease n=1 Tax=Micromonospora sicca TaxID=2202420 RepID=A0A317D061_9ACTN|nr:MULTISPECIES: HNH endonuclease [unclassified Micromonospora]MDZ5443645.1 HNH endonuclease [Micromonospora sp. 4G57]MDZ5488883.1 HNH endonuclease [Micromonospora sp. 4G53]PWR07196.1 HNH endonuclease [Micromonospora sp. 4G51]
MLSRVPGLSRHFTEESLRSHLVDRSVRRDDGCLIVRGYGARRGVHQKVAGRAWAHIAAYVVFVGGYDPALDVDHRCASLDCIEPTHLRQATRAESCRGRRQEPRCRNGHEREIDEATGRYRRVCRLCNREAQRRWREHRAAEIVTARATHGRGLSVSA